MADIDIAMLFLNAGVMVWPGGVGPFSMTTDIGIETTVNVNALHPMYLGKALID